MFEGIRSYFWERRRGFAIVAGVAGGAVMLTQYAKQKLVEMSERMTLEREGKENLRRRFQQNQEDCNFTVLALLPTLGTQILEDMDVDSLTAALQKRSRKPDPPAIEPTPAAAQTEPTESTQEAEAAPVVIVNGAASASEEAATPSVSEDTTSELDKPKPSLEEQLYPPPPPAPTVNGDHTSTPTEIVLKEDDVHQVNGDDPSSRPPESNGQVSGATSTITPPTQTETETEQEAESSKDLSESTSSLLASTSSLPFQFDNSKAEMEKRLSSAPPKKFYLESDDDGSNGATADNASDATVTLARAKGESDGVPSLPLKLDGEIAGTLAVEDPLDKMSKLEIWNEIKILSFARTLSSIYVVCLLALQTHIQLNLLGRYNYVSSVVDQASDKIKIRNNSLTDSAFVEDELNDIEGGNQGKGRGVSLVTESKYLTFSWWLLHQGWREVTERVRPVVEELVGPTALKTRMTFPEFKELIAKIRRRIEFSDDGKVGFSFANALFPDSPDSEVLVLAEGGMPEEDRYIDPQLRQLLDETEDFIDSEDFLTVRKTCLDRLFAVLERELEGSFKEPEGAQGQAVNGDAEGKEKSKGKEREGFLHPIQQRFRELEEGEDVDSRVARLASLLPIVARQSHLILNGIPNEYVEALSDVNELLEFSAVIYASYDRDRI